MCNRTERCCSAAGAALSTWEEVWAAPETSVLPSSSCPSLSPPGHSSRSDSGHLTFPGDKGGSPSHPVVCGPLNLPQVCALNPCATRGEAGASRSPAGREWPPPQRASSVPLPVRQPGSLPQALSERPALSPLSPSPPCPLSGKPCGGGRGWREGARRQPCSPQALSRERAESSGREDPGPFHRCAGAPLPGARLAHSEALSTSGYGSGE